MTRSTPEQMSSVTAPVSTPRRSTGVVMLVFFLVVGLLATLGAFSFLKIFVERMVEQETQNASKAVATSTVEAFKKSEETLDMAATSLLLSGQTPRNQAMAILRETIKELNYFDQIVVMYPKQGGGWMYYTLLPAPQGVPYTLQINENLIGDIIKKKFIDQRGVYFISPVGGKMPYVTADAFGANAPQASPYVLIRAISPGQLGHGLMIALGSADRVFDAGWREMSRDIQGVLLRERSTDYTVFNSDWGAGERQQSHLLDFEFQFAGRDFDLSLYHAQTDKIMWLRSIPYFILFFGIIFIFSGLLYFVAMQRQAARLREINDTLAFKNRQLQQESEKREYLNSALKKSEEENRSLIDSVSDIIFETNVEGKILFLNATWPKITGFDLEQSNGSDLFNMIHPQDQDKQRRDFTMLVKGQRQPYRSFTRLRTADGLFRSVEISFSMLRQDETKNLRVVGTITDVEERRRAERALVEAEKKYRAIVENAAGGIFQLTPEGIYLSANPALARILGYADADDLLRNVKNANESVYFNAKEREFFLKELGNAGTINNYETQVMRRDGTRIWVNENVRVVSDDQGSVLFYEGSLEDITQRKEAEMALREATIHSDLANRAKSEFLANMSHELRTPLNSIIGFSEIIKTETFGPIGQNAYKEYANDIYESGRRLLTVINEILDISKIEAGERHLNEQVVDVNELIDESLKLLESKARANNIIVSNMLKNVPKIVAEELAVKQVVVNILSNAIKFTPNGGRVTVTNERDMDGGLRISITDTGIGLDQNEIKKALSPFGQIDNTFNRSNAGTGLGLTLSDALMKLHDGRLELFSEKGIGTTVTIVFPADRVAQTPASSAADASTSAGTDPRGNPHTT